MAVDNEVRECMDCHKKDATVKLTTTPDRRDLKMFPRCVPCHDKRLKSARQTMNRYPEAFTGGCPFDDGGW